ncbi:MAG: hypothetical protein GX307_08460 [Euryarchaeota archaeon]|nr:hypothetical protein [Euryarchaeota archaeon]
MTPDDKSSGITCMIVDAGVCRFRTKISASCQDGKICFRIISDCPHVKKVQDELSAEVNLIEILRMPFSTNPIYNACGKVLAHSACPIPSALIKTAEAAAGFGLKRNVQFEFEG